MNLTQKPTLIDITEQAAKQPFTPTTHSTTRLTEFEYMRGLAIILIVLGHSVINTNDGFPLWLENIVRGGTGVFVFISGFFFHHVFAQRFDYRRFMSKKILNVFVPFLVVSAFAVVMNFIVFMLVDRVSAFKAAEMCWNLMKQGYILFPHWYIPFIIVTFLCSNLHFRYLQLPLFTQLSILILFAIISVVVHRPHGNVNVLQSVVYFTPFYLAGMLYSLHRDWMKKHYRYFFAAAVFTVISTVWLQSGLLLHVGGYHKAAFEWGGIDLQFIQKMGLCILFIGFCSHLVGPALGKHLTMLASISFAIFFLHPLISMIWGNATYLLLNAGYLEPNTTLLYSLVSSLALFVFQFYGSVWLIGKLKPLLGKKSRLLIGA
ncbi:acyltransferase family protein [Marinomonas shanghaiensis]|uniref:acyltransferase family protein n=1 Tax=Marinomonas shanghaiensis TaxID=2202418 RepID=UPI003A8DA7C2